MFPVVQGMTRIINCTRSLVLYHTNRMPKPDPVL